jgi:hypothetical protein
METILDLDWAAQPSEDYQAGGAGSYNVGPYVFRMTQMARADVFRNVNGVGLEAVATAGTNHQMTGSAAAPACPAAAYHFEDNYDDPADFDDYPWIFWWEFSSWNLPETANAVGVKGSSTGGNFGTSTAFVAGIRRGPFAGTPPADYGIQASGTGGLVINRQPFAEDWLTLAIVVWGRSEGASALGGPAAAFGNLEECWEFASISRMGSSAFAANQHFINPWRGLAQFCLPTQSTVGSPEAVLRRQRITKGWP